MVVNKKSVKRRRSNRRVPFPISREATPVERILESLEGSRQTHPGQWVALCPAHDDKRPSLSIREGEDGRVLIHCFAGCSALDVVESLCLGFDDLFPKADRDMTGPDTQTRRRPAPPISARDALDLLDTEALALEIVAHRLASGEPLIKHISALRTSAGRIAVIRDHFFESLK